MPNSPSPPSLGSKLIPPAVDATQVCRDSVCGTICGNDTARLILICAPPGFGKTTAMAQCRQRFEQAGLATAWLTLDAADNDLSRFLSFLHAMVDSLPGLAPAGSAPHTGSTLGELALALVDRLSAARTPFALFFDEFEAIHESATLAVVRELLDRLPAGGRLVVGTRSLPDLRLARLRARGLLMEIDAERLRFSLEETRRFFASRKLVSLASDELVALHRKTEGWVAALWLAGLALDGHGEPGAFIARFSGTHPGLADYLAEEVLAQQPEELRQFLLRTSILRELSLPLCEALMPELDSAAMLGRIQAANVFLVPIEGRPQAWRYHSLFAAFLRSQLQRELPSAVPGLHLAAARWFAAAGRPVPAIDHLLEAGDKHGAVEALSGAAMDLLMQGRLRLLTKWFDAIPATLLGARPMLTVAKLWAVCFTRGPQAAMHVMQSSGIEKSTELEVRAHVAALQTSLLALQDRWDEAYAVGRRFLPLLPSPSPFANASLVNALANSATVLGLHREARRLLDAARRTQGQGASAFHRMYSESVEGIIDLMEGRLRQAAARFRLAVQTTQASGLEPAHGNAWAGLLYAVSVYEANDLEQAAQMLQIYLPLARDVWLPDHIIIGHVMSSRIAFNKGEIGQAFQSLSELEYLGHLRQMPRLSASARLERARLLLMQGHLEAANTELQRADHADLWRFLGGHRYLAHDQEDYSIGALRWQLHASQARRDAAYQIRKTAAALASLLEDAEKSSRHRRALKLRLLYAMALARCGDGPAAEEQALRVLRAACAEGAVRVLLDEGPLAGTLFHQARSALSTQRPDRILNEFMHRLMVAFGPVAEDTGIGDHDRSSFPELVEPLTRKETRMLQLLAEGYSNRALTEKLFVSDSTVRTHLRNINSKLGAHNRTQAVAIARRLGVLR